MWTIYLQKTIKQSIKLLQKIGQARKYIYNSKKQTSKQESKQINSQGGFHNMPKNAKRKICAQEVTEIEEVTPATTCINTNNVNVNNLVTKDN